MKIEYRANAKLQVPRMFTVKELKHVMNPITAYKRIPVAIPIECTWICLTSCGKG